MRSGFYIGFTDNWVNIGDGAERNHHKPVSANVLNWDYFTLPHWPSGLIIANADNGKQYYRSENYADFSPYGWNKVE